MRPLKYSINVTLDGCIDHRVGQVDEELHRHATETIAQADALILGRTMYELMESAWRPAQTAKPEWMKDWMVPFADAINPVKKYVVSSQLKHVDWNAELLHGDLEAEVRKLKEQPGKSLYTAGVTLAKTLAQLGLIDEYQFIVQPVIAGHGPTLFAGLENPPKLKLVTRKEFKGGAVSLTYEPMQPK